MIATKQKKQFNVADLFCGAGGTSTGAIQALNGLGYQVHLTAINHWKTAVATHTLNHPDARHLCASLDSLNPLDLYRQGDLDLLWASPECTHHSLARGGKPISDQSRATAWCVIRWAEALKPGVILVENVPEFRTWGPTTMDGKRIASRAGSTFDAWTQALESIGYRVDHRILCAADYGDPTTRKRLFIQAVRGRRQIRWPDATHTQHPEASLFQRKAWRAAREIIDFNLPSQSIFNRQRPLAPKTLRRIQIGLERYGFNPFTIGIDHSRATSAPVRDIDSPLSTITCENRHALVEPFLIQVAHHGSDKSRARSVNDPLPTLCGNRGDWSLAQPYLVKLRGTSTAASVHEPVPTIAANGQHIALAEPFLLKYYGSETGIDSVNEPLDTVTAKGRFGLAQPIVTVNGEKHLLDVRFRMLQPKELSAATGFPATYRFAGNKSEVVKQIGNAVPPGLARALVTAVAA